MRTKLQNITVSLAAALTLLLPLKCGSMILAGAPQAWPDGVIGWLVTSPPPVFFVLVSGGLLLLALASFGAPRRQGRAAALTLYLWLLLPWVGLLGLARASSLEPGVIEFCYFTGLGSYAGMLAVLFSHRGAAVRDLLRNAACAGVLITAAVGVHQYFFGFEELRKFVLEQEARSGVSLPDDFKARIWDKRTYATFTFASALAGCILLMGPVTVFRLREWGKRFEPQKLSQWLFAGAGGAMLLGVFLSTRGRGAFLAGLIALGAWFLLELPGKKWKFAAVAGVLLAAAAGGWYIHVAGRGFGSMAERAGYWITAAKMVAEEPLCGSGWGDFTHHHAREKFFGNTELARDPHNLTASFAAAAGVPGLIFALLLLGAPLAAGLRRFRFMTMENKLLYAGLLAFSLHTWMDLDMQVPGLMGLLILVQFLTVADDDPAPERSGAALRAAAPALLGVIALAGGVHWLRAETALDALLNASGQAVGGIGTTLAPPSRVRQLVSAAAAAAPYAPGPYLAGGNYMLKTGDLREAEHYYLEAGKRSPEYWLIFQRLSEVAALRGDKERAEELHREAVRRFPLYFQLKTGEKLQ